MELIINRIGFMIILSKLIGYQEGINIYLGIISCKYMKQKISSWMDILNLKNLIKANNIKISNGSQSNNPCYSWSLWSFCSQTQPSKVRMVHLR